MNSVPDAVNSAKFTSKKIETHLEYVLPFSAMDDSSDPVENSRTKESGSIFKQNTPFFTSKTFFPFYMNINSWMCIKQTHSNL